MTFTLYKASDLNFDETITVNTLEELQAIGNDIIIHFEEKEIWIYDDYIE